MITYQCAHHGTTETFLGEKSWLYCGHDGTVHLACRPEVAPEGTARPEGWPVFLSWRTNLTCACGHPATSHEVGIGICDDCDCSAFRAKGA